jgi:hypothetical protein
LQHFAEFCGILWRVGNKFSLQDHMFGGVKTPPPFLVGWK